ncbi:hypothetical protein [Pengzhenrongella sicca]|uniref:Uncharacterized protein n=1 Tax=Pengzhenrongella sicca TaxID=2819238 RepID=A0A8A4ZNH2_9MICO|nr:hypothetical protein [Pengzhenrongella sicca]QTE31098.1 hypothetical protein J4E96_09340 [Pengzhenrongella sicca]
MGSADDWTYDDALILISLPTRGWTSVRGMLSTADHHNHGVPNQEVLAEVVARLVASGLVGTRDRQLGATAKGRALQEGTKASGGYDLIVEVLDRLEAIPRHEGPPIVSPESLEKSSRHYGDPSWRRLWRRIT